MDDSVTVRKIPTTEGKVVLAVSDASPWRAKALAYLCQDAVDRLLGQLHRLRKAAPPRHDETQDTLRQGAQDRPEEGTGMEAESEAVEVGVLTRIYQGKSGRIVLTVMADDMPAASLLGRVCGSAVEAAVFKTFDDRLRQD